jgi:WD40 repeat protein
LDGSILYAVSADRSINVISGGRIEGHMPKAHKGAINKVLHLENSHVIATGDDDGVVKVWDLRLATSGKACVMELKDHEGTVTDMAYRESEKMLLTSAGDGTLGVFDMRTSKLYAMSDSFGED